jgi:hypothetical protein
MLSAAPLALDAGVAAGRKRPRSQRSEQFRGQTQIRPYDKSKEETILAKVLEVKELARGHRVIAALVIDVDGQDTQIPLGPAEYVKEKGISFSAGDEITIKGIKTVARQEGAAEEWRGRHETRGEGDDPKRRNMGQGDTKNEVKGRATDPKDAKEVSGGLRAEKNEAIGATNDGRAVRSLRIRTREVTKGTMTLTVLTDEGAWAWDPQKPAAEDSAKKGNAGKPK